MKSKILFNSWPEIAGLHKELQFQEWEDTEDSRMMCLASFSKELAKTIKPLWCELEQCVIANGLKIETQPWHIGATINKYIAGQKLLVS